MSAKSKTGTVARIDSTQLKPSEISIVIKHMVKVNLHNAANNNKRRGLMIWGGPGLGKSALVAQQAKAINYKLLDIRLSQMESSDLRGIPVPINLDTPQVSVIWAIPHMLPRRYVDEFGRMHATCKFRDKSGVLKDGVYDAATDTEYDGVIIMLDELPSAAISVQASSYQMVLDAALGEWLAPQNCVVIAAGNRETDRGGTYKMLKPLENRFTHVEIKADYEDWVENAVNESYHPDVIGYVSAYKAELYQFDPKSSSRGFATPRSWEATSDIIRGDPNIPHHVMFSMIGGTVGDGIAAKFMEHRTNAAKLPKASDVLDGKVLSMPIKETSLMFSLTTAMCYELRERHLKLLPSNTQAKTDPATKKKFDSNVDNFLGFMMKEFPPEMVIMGSRTALSNFRIKFNPTDMKNWDTFSDRYEDIILAV